MKEVNKVTKFDIFIIFMLVGIVPFLMQAVIYDMPLSDGTVQMFDIFNYVKVFVIKLVALLILASSKNSNYDFLVNFKTKIKSIDKKFYFAMLIILSVIVAYIFSDYKEIARFGAFERFEGIWIHFSYIIIFLYMLKVFKKEGAFDIFSYAILLSAFIVGGIGTLQFLNVDVFSSNIIKTLAGYKDFNVEIASQGSFTTMYNINTSASYSLLIMFILMLIVILNKKNAVKGFAIFDFVLMFITFYNSMSEASFIAASISVVAIIIVYILSIIIKGNRKRLIGISAFISCLVLIGVVFLGSSGLVTTMMDKATNVNGYVKWEQNENELYFYNKNDDYLKLVILDDGFEAYEGNIISEDSNLIYTSDGTETHYFFIEGEKFTSGVRYVISETGEKYILFSECIRIKNEEGNIVLSDEITGVVNSTADYIGFENYPSIMSYRGYIWSRSIPLFIDKPIVGYGSDVFFEVFPTDDIVEKNIIGLVGTTVDKPHSIYLNMAINNGVFYLIGFLGIVCLVLFDKLKLLYQLKGNNIQRLAICIYVGGVVAYLVNGLATDNLVVIVMTFWVYLAISDEIFEIDEEDEFEVIDSE